SMICTSSWPFPEEGPFASARRKSPLPAPAARRYCSSSSKSSYAASVTKNPAPPPGAGEPRSRPSAQDHLGSPTDFHPVSSLPLNRETHSSAGEGLPADDFFSVSTRIARFRNATSF